MQGQDRQSKSWLLNSPSVSRTAFLTDVRKIVVYIGTRLIYTDRERNRDLRYGGFNSAARRYYSAVAAIASAMISVPTSACRCVGTSGGGSSRTTLPYWPAVQTRTPCS